MLDYINFEALGHLSLLPLSSPRSSRSSCGREELPPIFHFHLPPKAHEEEFFKNYKLSFLFRLDRDLNPEPCEWQPGLMTIRP
jgi:hypothetical protein